MRKKRFSLFLTLLTFLILVSIGFSWKFSGLFQADSVVKNQNWVTDSTLAEIPVLDTQIKLDSDKNESFFETKKYALSAETGYPVLPYYDLEILISPDADEKSVTTMLVDEKTEELPGTFDIKPGPKIEAMIGEALDDNEIKPNLLPEKAAVYSEDHFYPSKNIEVTNVGEMRKWKIAKVRYYPYTYNPVSKKIKLTSSANVKVSFSRPQIIAAMSSTDRVVDSEVKESVDNYSEAVKYYNSSIESKNSNILPASNNYTIITTSAIKNSSQQLNNFIIQKQNRGFAVSVAVESDWGGGTGNTAAEHMRTYLKNNYVSRGMKYVLMIGNPDPDSGSVPMKMVYPSINGSVYPNPTDYYYADLSSDWDSNHNGRSGESSESGAIDGNPEVYVGRIPYYGSVPDLDAILNKSMDYEAGRLGEDWEKKALLTMVDVGSGAQSQLLGEQINDNILQPAGFQATRIYDQTNGVTSSPESTPVTNTNIKNRWNEHQGFHFINAHGNYYAIGSSSAIYFQSSDSAYLNDSYPSFTFQSACETADPTQSNNLAYSLLKRGAVSTIGATNYSWFVGNESDYTNTDTSGGLEYRYAKKMITDNKSSGESFYLTLSEYRGTYFWVNHVVFVLYGDPSLTYRTADATKPVIQSVSDDGKFSARPNQIYSSWVASDPESAITEYRYEILQDSVTGTEIRPWTPVGENTDALVSELNLTEGNTYFIGIKAKNASDVWSDPMYSNGIIYDLTPPSVPSLTSHNFTFGDKLNIGGTKTGNTKKVLLDGNEAAVDNNANTWSGVVEFPAVGKKTLSLVGQDESTNQTDGLGLDLYRYKMADANNDSAINIKDFSALLAGWKKTGSELNAHVDFNSDGQAEMKDFSILLANWGK